MNADRAARLLRPFAVVWASAVRFYRDQCLMRASALAYTSLLSLVPLLALMFAVLKGLGVQHRLEPLLLSRLSLDATTTEQIISYIDRTNVGTLGTVGAATLVLTVISVLGTIEGSFNFIWRVGRARTILRQVTDYLGVVLLTPFLLLAATAITSASQVQHLIGWATSNGYVGGAAMRALQLTPILINTVAIGILYAIMPNRRVAPVPLLVGAVFAGAAWHAVQTVYVSLQVGVARYDAIYGALAQLPVTLVWLYVSWSIVLAGAELAAVLEYGIADAAVSAGVRGDAVALQLLVGAGDAFASSGAPVDVRTVARELCLDVAVVGRAGAELAERGWLTAVDGRDEAYVLGRDPARIALRELVDRGPSRLPAACDPRVRAAFDLRGRGAALAWQDLTLADVLRPPS